MTTPPRTVTIPREPLVIDIDEVLQRLRSCSGSAVANDAKQLIEHLHARVVELEAAAKRSDVRVGFDVVGYDGNVVDDAAPPPRYPTDSHGYEWRRWKGTTDKIDWIWSKIGFGWCSAPSDESGFYWCSTGSEPTVPPDNNGAPPAEPSVSPPAEPPASPPSPRPGVVEIGGGWTLHDSGNEVAIRLPSRQWEFRDTDGPSNFITGIVRDELRSLARAATLGFKIMEQQQ